MAHTAEPGLEVIKLEFILKLKIKRNDWLLSDTCPQQPIVMLYFEFETVLKFYNLEARTFSQHFGNIPIPLFVVGT